ncbi:MAG: DinB family protein [Actinomycetota bacterium]|nr:DinB family protein [Actinomycetota bacterium]
MFAGIASDLHRYLQDSRDSILASLDGLSEHDARRPLTPTGTNLLGLVKHLSGVELGYLGDCVGRAAPVTLPWYADGSVWDGADMWLTADETREDIVGFYRAAWAHSDESIAQLPLDAPAHVEWWPEERRDTTFGSLLVRVVAETAQHAGHCDIVRETIDGHAGSNTGEVPANSWPSYVAQVQAAADRHR